MAISNTMNLGSMDRMIRGVLGAMLLQNSFMSPMLRLWKMAAGVGLLMTAINGMCPMMKRMGMSTIPGKEDNVVNQLKQAAPGQGVNPMQTEQASPQTNSQSLNMDKPMADVTAIR